MTPDALESPGIGILAYQRVLKAGVIGECDRERYLDPSDNFRDTEILTIAVRTGAKKPGRQAWQT